MHPLEELLPTNVVSNVIYEHRNVKMKNPISLSTVYDVPG